MIHKRKRVLALVLILLISLSLVFSGCGNSSEDIKENGENAENGFSVTFIDVGNGDSIFINFGDGKSMLIDCAEKSSKNLKSILNVLEEKSINTITYLVLTHPDADHTGNALDIIDDIKIENAFLPKINDLSKLVEYSKIVEKLEENQVDIDISRQYLKIEGEDYLVLFLSPLPYGNKDSSYNDYNLESQPTEKMSNDLSPIIYLEYRDVTFLFTGDASKSQEKIVIEHNNLGFYSSYLNDNEFSLENIDFLKVAHHGASESSSLDFLNLIKPKNAVISVGGDNYYGHPSSTTIQNLIECNEDINIYRTDRDGTVEVSVSEDGNCLVAKESEK